MAESIAPGQIKRVVLSAVADTATRIDYTAKVRRVRVHFVKPDNGHDQAGKFALLGTDGAAVNAAYFTVHGDEIFEHLVAPGRALSQAGSFFVASGTASAIAEIIAYEA